MVTGVDAFEYLSVLISIVLGLGVTQLLLGFGRWLEQRSDFRPYGPSIAWAGLLLLVHVQTWWAMYGMRLYDHWTFLQFSVVLLQPILLFLLAVLVFPGPSTKEHDLRRHFFAQRPWFFGLFMALLLVSLLKDVIRQGDLPGPLNLAFHLVLLLIGGAGFTFHRPSVHAGLAYGGLSLIVAYIGLLFADL